MAVFVVGLSRGSRCSVHRAWCGSPPSGGGRTCWTLLRCPRMRREGRQGPGSFRDACWHKIPLICGTRDLFSKIGANTRNLGAAANARNVWALQILTTHPCTAGTGTCGKANGEDNSAPRGPRPSLSVGRHLFTDYTTDATEKSRIDHYSPLHIKPVLNTRDTATPSQMMYLQDRQAPPRRRPL